MTPKLKTVFQFTFVAISVLLFTSAEVVAFQIKIKNHQPGSTIRYPVVLLRGTAQGVFADSKINNKTAREGAGNVSPVFHDGKFKALVELSAGKNLIEFVASDDQRFEFAINYKPQTNPHYVRIIWMTDKTGATEFAAPDDTVSQDYEARLRTAAELMQTFTAERMNELGIGRKTFRLERDDKGQVVVHTWKAPHAAQHYYEMNDQAWWQDVFRWLNREHADPLAKNMVLAAFTRKDSESGKMKAHTALGGGNLGLFGSASVFSWPRSIESTTVTFLDSSRYETANIHDDSVGRSTIWGLASTTMGATLHEMGHTFGLMHVQDGKGIMSRGFDHFNRAFTFQDPPSGRNDKAVYHGHYDEALFAKISGTMLQWSPWFQLDGSSKVNHRRPKITFDSEKDTYTIKSSAGIPWVGFMTAAHDITAFKEFGRQPFPKEITLTQSEIKEILGAKTLTRMITIDAAGMENGFNVRQSNK